MIIVETFEREGEPRGPPSPEATHLRSLAANATTVQVKARLLKEAREHEDIAQSEAEPVSASEA